MCDKDPYIWGNPVGIVIGSIVGAILTLIVAIYWGP